METIWDAFKDITKNIRETIDETLIPSKPIKIPPLFDETTNEIAEKKIDTCTNKSTTNSESVSDDHDSIVYKVDDLHIQTASEDDFEYV